MFWPANELYEFDEIQFQQDSSKSHINTTDFRFITKEIFRNSNYKFWITRSCDQTPFDNFCEYRVYAEHVKAKIFYYFMKYLLFYLIYCLFCLDIIQKLWQHFRQLNCIREHLVKNRCESTKIKSKHKKKEKRFRLQYFVVNLRFD